MDANCGPIVTRLAKIANRNFYRFCAAGIGTTVVLAAGRPTFRKSRKVGHPRFFSATVKGNPRETYSPEMGATRPLVGIKQHIRRDSLGLWRGTKQGTLMFAHEMADEITVSAPFGRVDLVG